MAFNTFLSLQEHNLTEHAATLDSSDVIINVTDLAGTSIEKARAVIQSQTHVPAELVPEDDSKVLFSYNADINAYER